MPLLKIETNLEIEPSARPAVLTEASKLVSEMLGKPEQYVMISLQHNPDLLFAGENTPLAYIELKSIGLPENRTEELSARLCSFLEERLGVPKQRVYIEFANAPRSLWGWNGATF